MSLPILLIISFWKPSQKLDWKNINLAWIVLDEQLNFSCKLQCN